MLMAPVALLVAVVATAAAVSLGLPASAGGDGHCESASEEVKKLRRENMELRHRLEKLGVKNFADEDEELHSLVQSKLRSHGPVDDHAPSLSLDTLGQHTVHALETTSCPHPGGIPELDIAPETLGAGTCSTPDNPGPTADPRVFGPPFWKTFHLLAANYPDDPNEKVSQSCINFIEALPWLLPCPHCGHHLSDFVDMNKDCNGKTSGTYRDGEKVIECACMGAPAPGEDVCRCPAAACQNRNNLVSFFVRAHNNVNSGTHPCRQRYTTKLGIELYSQTKNTCYQNIIWGSCQIPHTVDQLTNPEYCGKKCCGDGFQLHGNVSDKEQICCEYVKADVPRCSTGTPECQ